MTELIKLPGLIDPHTHLRVPGGEHKEDFSTGTSAALAGGVTMVLAMPNTSPPITTPQVIQKTREVAGQDARCDVGLFAGASSEHIDQLPVVAPAAAGLKIYLNDTFGPLRVEDLPTLQACFESWPRDKMIAMHAEGQSIAAGIGLAASFARPVHFCHISRRDEIELIARAKAQGLPVTCEVTPHHLFLNERDAIQLGPLGDMRPRLATTDDQAALWAHIDSTVDCIATDHAPHTLDEKASATAPPGVAGLQTSLPLMLTAVKAGRLTLQRLTELMAIVPRRIFSLPEQEDTYVEVDLDAQFVIDNGRQLSKCGWTPFAGTPVTGQVQRVILRGQVAYDLAQPQLLAHPGMGWIIP
ncbi:MAG: amidohydrolase family protein [Chloroflexota bacterium]|nr:amidohydrolase family protein [Chloroflexota bacterium]